MTDPEKLREQWKKNLREIDLILELGFARLREKITEFNANTQPMDQFRADWKQASHAVDRQVFLALAKMREKIHLANANALDAAEEEPSIPAKLDN